MKAMILAAGRGERLRPLTDRVPKPMVTVRDRPLLAHQLGWLARAGIRDVVINLHHLGQQIVDAFGDGARYGVRITYSLEPELLETGGGIVKALPLLGNEPFLIVNGDIFTDFPLSELPRTLGPDTGGHLVLAPRPTHRDQGDFELRGDRVTGRGDDYVYCGIAVLSPAALSGRPAAPFSLRDVFFELMAAGGLSAQIWDGAWTDIGTPEQLQAVNAAWRSQS